MQSGKAMGPLAMQPCGCCSVPAQQLPCRMRQASPVAGIVMASCGVVRRLDGGEQVSRRTKPHITS